MERIFNNNFYIFSERAAVQFVKINGLWSVITVNAGAIKTVWKIALRFFRKLKSTFCAFFDRSNWIKLDYSKVN